MLLITHDFYIFKAEERELWCFCEKGKDIPDDCPVLVFYSEQKMNEWVNSEEGKNNMSDDLEFRKLTIIAPTHFRI